MVCSAGPRIPLEAFLVAVSTVGIAEIGDRTQFLALILATRYRRPWPIIAGMLVATLVNHGVAGALGVWLGSLLTPGIMGAAVGISMIAMALWTLRPDRLEGTSPGGRAGPFVATLVAFFIAELGDKTQIATMALGAAYTHLVPVVAGSTCGLLAANLPVIFLGKVFADRLPLQAIRYGAAALFLVLGLVFLWRAAAIHLS